MPPPGSRSYDVQRTRLRNELDDEGIQSRRNDGLEHAGGGDPGAVIDLRSPAFSNGTRLPPRCSKHGGNVSPALEWSAPPDGTAELVLLCEDPDAPGGTFVHWLVSGIDPGTTSIAEGQEPAGSGSWQNGYRGTRHRGPPTPTRG